MQDTHFTCAANCRVLEDDYVVLSAYSSLGVSLLIGCSLNADVNFVLADDWSWLVVVDVAVKSFEFRVARVFAPNIAVEGVSFFRRLVPFLDNLKLIVLVGEWNAIPDPKINSVVRGARESGRCESSPTDFMAHHDLVERFHLNHPVREMWTWLNSSLSVRVKFYLNQVLEDMTLILLRVPRSTMLCRLIIGLLGSVCD